MHMMYDKAYHCYQKALENERDDILSLRNMDLSEEMNNNLALKNMKIIEKLAER